MLRMPKPATVDFETFGIAGRPEYPPVPVGVSIIKPGSKKSHYYAWGHYTGNNCTWAEAKAALEEVWDCPDGVLFHNAKFDIDVAEVHMDLPPLPWDRIHDTMILLFLDDPNQTQLGLKPSADRLLNMPPEEQDAVAEWLVQHQPVPGLRVTKSKNTKNSFARFMPLAPGEIVGRYAHGDTDRTLALFKHLWKSVVVTREMGGAYDRERELLPCLLDMERQGLRLDLERLRKDVTSYTKILVKCGEWIKKELKSPDLNIDSGAQLIEALVKSGVADPSKIPTTANGKYKSDKQTLTACCVGNSAVAAVLQYRSQLKTCLNTFMKPWLETAEKSGGFIFTSWNQTKSAEGHSAIGTRTGRLSSTPNFQNIPKQFQPIFYEDRMMVDDKEDRAKFAAEAPKMPFKMPKLPMVRSYVIAYADGEIMIDRDYSQQEPRILAHFEDGQLKAQYIQNPWIDYHDNAKQQLEATLHRHFMRKKVKNINLGIIYGMGAGAMAARNNATVEETKELKKHIMDMYPGLKEMYKDMKARAKADKPIRTWGGREYYCEPPKIVNGRIMHFEYKMVNTLIQGSAGDCTKEAMIRFYRAKKPHWHLFLQVHDQLTVSVPAAEVEEAMEVLRVCMEEVPFDVPMKSEGTVSDTNWAELKDYDVKGKLVWHSGNRTKSPRGVTAGSPRTTSARSRQSSSSSTASKSRRTTRCSAAAKSTKPANSTSKAKSAVSRKRRNSSAS